MHASTWSCRRRWHRAMRSPRHPAPSPTARAESAPRHSRRADLVLRAARRSCGLAEIDAQYLRIVRNGLRRALRNQLAMMQDDDALGELHYRAHYMLDHDQREIAAAMHVADGFQH